MTPVYQTIIDIGDGDCQRASVASILDLTIEQVPHFLRFGQDWFDVFNKFMKIFKWVYSGTCSINAKRGLKLEDSIDGYFLCSVPSLTFKDVSHSIIVDIDGTCVHDPNPNGLYKDKNIYDIEERKDHVVWSLWTHLD